MQKTGFLELKEKVTISSWKKGDEEKRVEYEPVSYLLSNIIKYYD